MDEVKFGDGYAQRAPAGLNSMPEKWPIQMSEVSPETKAAVIDFLRARAGAEAFQWTPYGELTTKLWLCRSWRATPAPKGNWDISATFEQVPL